MITYVNNVLKIVNPTDELKAWISENLEFENPEYLRKIAMGLWLGSTPKKIKLYEWQGKRTVVIPYGCIYKAGELLKQGEVVLENTHNHPAIFNGYVELYQYQKVALYEMIKKYCGMLIAPAGSGKTQIGLAICQLIHRRCLWVTHTQDLLTQSYERAKRYFNEDVLGTITKGEVNCGDFITFATVQTLKNIDLDRYKDYWDLIIVDEAHRVCVSADSVSMFEKVLNNLSARWKYGLTATAHRADGLIRASFALLGDIIYEVPETAVADKIIKPTIVPIPTGTQLDESCYNTDGTLNHPAMMRYLTNDVERNGVILRQLVLNKGRSCLILSSRVQHLKDLYDALPEDMQAEAAVIDGSMTRKWALDIRHAAIVGMRHRQKKYLFATFGLAKEGLDIPCLDRLFLVTPQKDYAITTQAIGRVSRSADGKTEAIVYDFVDNDKYLLSCYNKRKTHYRKAHCEIREDK